MATTSSPSPPSSPLGPGPRVATTADRCPECGSRRLERDSHGELVCSNCGLVVQAEVLDRGPEWRAFDAEELRARARAEARVDPLAPGDGLGSLVGKRPGWERLRRTARSISSGSGSDKRFQQARRDLRSIAHRLQCPDDVASEAETTLLRARRAGLTRGRSYRALAAATLLMASRNRHLGRSEAEVAESAGETLARIRAAYGSLSRELGMAPPPLSPSEAVNRVATRVGADLRAAGKAQGQLTRLERQGKTGGTHPMGWAAAGVYVAAKELGRPVSLRKLAKAADVSVPTIRARVKDLLNDGA